PYSTRGLLYRWKQSCEADNDSLAPPKERTLSSELETSTKSRLAWTGLLLLAVCGMLAGGCRTRQTNVGPFVEFTRVPLAEEGGPDKLDVIEGRVIGAHSELQVVLFARSGTWYIQPFANQTFTQIQPDSRW